MIRWRSRPLRGFDRRQGNHRSRLSTAARILDLLRDLSKKTCAAILLITHDLAVVAQTCQRVAVMHAGQLVETSPVRNSFAFRLIPIHKRSSARSRALTSR